MDLGLHCSIFGQVWLRDEALPFKGVPSLWGIQQLLHVASGEHAEEGPAKNFLQDGPHSTAGHREGARAIEDCL